MIPRGQTTTTDITVVVCAYTVKRWNQLRAALLSAAAQQPPPDRLLLVVDHNDELLERARTSLIAEVPGLEVVASTRKQGLSGARNTAIELAGSELIAFLDDDAVARPGWLSRLSAPFDDPMVLGVGGAAMPRWPAGERPVMLPATTTTANPAGRGELDWVVGCTYAGQPTRLAPVRNLMGCAMVLRRGVFAEVGGFSEDLGRLGVVPLGCEETELCIRATAAIPGRLLLEPAAVVDHDVSADRVRWRYLWNRAWAEGISKAMVTRLTTRSSSLSAEGAYVTQVLSRAAGSQLARGRLVELFAVLSVLVATTAGYLRGTVALAARRGQRSGSVQPVPPPCPV